MRFPNSLHADVDAASESPFMLSAHGPAARRVAPELPARSRALSWTLVLMALGLLAVALHLALRVPEAVDPVWSIGSPGAGGSVAAALPAQSVPTPLDDAETKESAGLPLEASPGPAELLATAAPVAPANPAATPSTEAQPRPATPTPVERVRAAEVTQVTKVSKAVDAVDAVHRDPPLAVPMQATPSALTPVPLAPAPQAVKPVPAAPPASAASSAPAGVVAPAASAPASSAPPAAPASATPAASAAQV